MTIPSTTTTTVTTMIMVSMSAVAIACVLQLVPVYVQIHVQHDVGVLASSVVSRLVARHVMKILIGLVNGIILKSLVL